MAFVEVDRWSGLVAVVAAPAPLQGRIWAVYPWDPVNNWYIQDGTIPELTGGQYAGAMIMVENPVGSTRNARYYTTIEVTVPSGVAHRDLKTPSWVLGLGLDSFWNTPGITQVWRGEESPITVPLQGRWWEVIFEVAEVGNYSMETVLYAEPA